MYLLLDNYDSFTWNIYHLLGKIGIDAVVKRHDEITASQALDIGQKAIFISPGPCTPNEAGISLEVVAKADKVARPIFGVCLGMQVIFQYYGGLVKKYSNPKHGKIGMIESYQKASLQHIPKNFTATRYHSLICDEETLPDDFGISAKQDNLIMGIYHKKLPIEGVQFHPESIKSEYGQEILTSFLSQHVSDFCKTS